MCVWIFKWRENTPDGRVNKKVVVGTVEQFPTKTAARKAAEPLRINAIADNPAVPVTVTQLVKHYTNNELPNKAHSTQRTVEASLNVWITPKWGEHRLSDVRTVEVECWLHGLLLANATKAKVRNVMHVIFAHACRHEWLQKNPISLVRQSAKRKKTPDVLEAEELKKLLAYCQPEDWVFVSPKMNGKQPYWPETPLKCFVLPAAKRLGIAKQIGWHSFRRTFATLLKGSGEDVKTTQELMRHANSRLTLDVYAQALTPAKRAAHLKVVELIRPAAETGSVPLCSYAEEAESVSA